MSITSRILVLLSLGFALPLAAEDAAKSVFQRSFADSFTSGADKIVQLANAFSEEQLAWRPAAGVRSTREAIMHVAQANFFLGSRLGAKVPEGINPGEVEKFAGAKAEMVALLKQSIDFAREAVAAVPENELGAEIAFFGQRAPRMRFILILDEHVHEHLGQLIAYARSNGVVPPWSQ